jgi:zinc resistance-associated protein
MKTALSAIALATALTLAPFNGGSFAVADDSAQRQQRDRFTPEDRAAFLDARIAALKAGLELNAEQEKNWAPLESAMRDLAKQRAERFAAWRERRDENQDDDVEINPIDRLARTSERLSARAADLQKLAAAAKPFYDSLDDSQKRRFAVLFRGPMGHGEGRHWRREGDSPQAFFIRPAREVLRGFGDPGATALTACGRARPFVSQSRARRLAKGGNPWRRDRCEITRKPRSRRRTSPRVRCPTTRNLKARAVRRCRRRARNPEPKVGVLLGR